MTDRKPIEQRIPDKIRRTYYLAGLRHAKEAAERVLRNWEHSLEEKHELHGHPVTDERVRGMPLIRQSADIARVRLVVVAEIERLMK